MKRSFYIAGVQFRPREDINKVVNILKIGDMISLSPEPSNKFDPNAVRIIKDEFFLGYVPKKFSSEISALMEIGGELKCVVEAVNPDAKAWEKIKVAIVDEEEVESYIDKEDVI